MEDIEVVVYDVDYVPDYREAEEQRQALIAQLKAQKENLEDQYKRLGNSAYPGSNEERENIRRQINEIDSRLAELG